MKYVFYFVFTTSFKPSMALHLRQGSTQMLSLYQKYLLYLHLIKLTVERVNLHPQDLSSVLQKFQIPKYNFP